MLHAFNQKNVRRVLAASGDEHTNEKNEDAITSMVFTPLAFMSPESALEVMMEVLGDRLTATVDNRPPVSHEPQLWPIGLRSSGWEGGRPTACEPDLVIRFEFDSGPPLILIGEMKWDWRVTPGHLEQETSRQRSALEADEPNAARLVFVITKFHLTTPLNNVLQLTWVQVHDAASRLASRSRASPARRWGELVRDFLERAEQIAFQGFPPADMPMVTGDRPVFWRAA